MLKVDFRRAFTTPLFYIMIGVSFVMPILILVMVTMMDGSVTVDPQTGVETVMDGFKNVWEIIGSISSGKTSGDVTNMNMSLATMCNINLIFFAVAVFVCIFVSDDFRSGYAKNLFAVRSNKKDYIISKTTTSFIVGALMILAFFVGTLIGGAIAGLPFDFEGFDALNLANCIISKTFLMLAIVPIYLLMAIIAKQKLWLSLLLSLAGGALLFMMIPMITPLNATILNVILCMAGGAMLSISLGFVDNLLLDKRDIL